LLSKLSPADFRKAQRGAEKKSSMRPQDTPATAKKGQVPHDCKQYDFPSGPLESLDILKNTSYLTLNKFEVGSCGESMGFLVARPPDISG
jgi:hypothetical protein